LCWERLGAALDAGGAGGLAVEARLERKARDYHPPSPVEPDVRVLPDESAHSTVVEVRAADALGLLHAIAAALGDLDLDVRVAQIDTLRDRVVDTFYVRPPGLFTAVAAALGDLGLDVRVAKIDPLGDRVVDTFYVRSPWGAKLSDE